MSEKTEWRVYETVGIGIGNAASINKIVDCNKTLFYIDPRKCINFTETICNNEMEDMALTKHSISAKLKMFFNEHSLDEISNVWNGLIIQDEFVKRYCDIRLVKFDLIDLEKRGQFVKHSLSFDVYRSKADSSIIDLSNTTKLVLLGEYSNDEAKRIYKEALSEFFEMEYAEILLAYPNPLVRDISKKIADIEAREKIAEKEWTK